MTSPVAAKLSTSSWLRPGSSRVPAWLWLASGLVWVAFAVGLWFWPLVEDHSALYHLMAALAEAMAAVLALVFTISLVVAELTAAYSHRLFQRLLTPFTISYIILFILTMMLPLTMMTHATVGGAKVSLILGALALVLLIPYFRYFMYRITPAAMLEDLAIAGRKNLRGGREAIEVDTIDNISMSAFEFKDYDTFNLALMKLGDLALVQPDSSVKKGAVPEGDVWERFRDVALATLEESRGSRISIGALQRAGILAAEAGLSDAVRKSATTLEIVGGDAVEKGLDTVARQTVYAIGEIGRTAAEHRLEEAAREGVYTIRKVGVAATEKRLKYTVPFTIDALEAIGAVAAGTDQPGVVRQVAATLLEVGVEAVEHGLDEAARQAAFALESLQVRKGGAEAVADALKSFKAGVEVREAVARFLDLYRAELR